MWVVTHVNDLCKTLMSIACTKGKKGKRVALLVC